MGGFPLRRQPCQLHDSNFASDTPATTVQCDFADRELASSRASGLRRCLMGAAVAWGEDVATQQSVSVGIRIYRLAWTKNCPVLCNTRSYARRSCHRYQAWSCYSLPSARWRRSGSRRHWSSRLHLVRGHLADRRQNARHNEYPGIWCCSMSSTRWPRFRLRRQLSPASSATNRRCRLSSLPVEPL